ncbi:ABC transporter permease [Paenibacillus macerans]|uniref:FtsX-like permease family protein n=1 Tax=Paenibacillus macerans TaxID=44252 RepID=A0A090ZDA4_PAEMA|nr:ABC transporter permease [Paenibacillus macerans]KFN08408.1 ftsX-like permease family protein [Paenibacillus macerans]MCY7557139.1 ABC transporter permease [Paenibacillus macerans]MEC0135427.1 ABC transporter permease [Paenibacillus macerans]MEC0152468.1 ABC transporter permease [Paenibacillus macerans]MUG24553.1 FtsX-like permease family protein [Paenibacillus macerans]
MKSYLGLVAEYAKAHKQKNRLTVVCIAISVMLVAAVFGMADMSVKAQINENIRQKGNYHAAITGISDSTAGQIANRNDVKVAGWIGMAEDTVFQGKRLSILGGEQDIAEQMNLVVQEGAYPASEREALLDRPALEQFGLSIGDTIDIALSDGQKREYKITGTYNNFSSLKGTDSHGLYLSTKGIRALPPSKEYYFIQFKSNVNINRALSEIKAEYGLGDQQVSTNLILLGLLGQSDDSAMIDLYLTAGILFVLITMAATFMIASSFNMSVLERTQFFGLLRCLGATKKQIKRYIRREGLLYCLKGIPIGLLAGCCVMWAAVLSLNALNYKYLPEMPVFQVSWPAMTAGTAIGFLVVMLASRSPAQKAAQVSPQAAVTGNINHANHQPVNRAANTKWFRVDTAMGFQHAFSNKKSMVLISGSFALSIVLFLCFSVLIAFMGHALRPLKPYAPDLSIVGVKDSILLDRTLMEEVKALPHIKNIYGRMVYRDIPPSQKQGDNTATLISYDDPQFKWAEDKLISGSRGEVQNGNGVFVSYSEELKWKVGDTITLQLPSGAYEVQVAGILSDTPFVAAKGESMIICSEATFTALTGISDYTIIDMQVDADISEQVRSLITPQMRLLDKQQANRETRAAYYAMAVFVYGFLIVIALVALINILNTVNASVSSRMANYGVMRAVGMSGKQLKRMVAAESAAYAISGSLTGGVLGLLLHRFFFGLMITSNWGDPWQPPITVLAVTILAATLTTFAAVISPAKKVKKTSIVNVVNAQ